ncbi:bifunctional hydroxymethylpyrimidine kinase/phosphomethylpyrimidine kinase, partial [Nitratireductor sp. GCM10026969]|uniref:bifunctional hydroxymethylpyrimidine kinase/phosphomethylpyrimidine kinase n=1 Tax=Nitratireductor sp. GCM10026969 TaxID=3252645 RepID=UPI0036212563
PALVAAQMKAAFEAAPIGAVKIGMLATRQTIEAVASALEAHCDVPAVLDPVLAATSGGALLETDAVAALKARLMPLCRLVTPNLPELATLTGGTPAADENAAMRQGEALLEEGARAVLIKGGHDGGDHATDILLQPARKPVRFEAPRLEAHMRGTGCMLASAASAGLAAGHDLEESVRAAKAWLHAHLVKASQAEGMG